MLTRDMNSRSTNTTTTLDARLHHPNTINSTGTATKGKATAVPQRDFQSGETYSPMERWYKEYPSQQSWNGVGTEGTAERR
jgi:hypothetical protein